MNVAATEIVNDRFGRLVYGADIQLLKDASCGMKSESLWLNDQILNHCMDLLVERAYLIKNGMVYAMDTFFWTCLRDLGYERAKQIAGNVDILRYDTVLVPIHSRNHWGLATIQKNRREIKYYDSLGRTSGDMGDVLTMLEGYIKAECRNRYKFELDTTLWTKRTVKNIPRQANAYDCGVFVCAYAESIARNQHDFKFTQEHMPYFRKKIAYEIATGRLLN